MFIAPWKILRVTAVLAACAVVAMIGIFVTTGVGQDPLQFVHPPDEYLRLLLQDPPALRACLALDNAFIMFYGALFVVLGGVLLRTGAARGLVLVSTGLLVGLAVLDMIENFHFMVMLSRAELGIAPSVREIDAQVFESLLKFHVSYLGLFLFGLAMPRRTRAERALATASFVQLPIGILIYVVPRALAVPLVFARFTYFLAALVLVAWTFGRAPSVASTDSSAPA